MKLVWYDERHLKCPSCNKISPSFYKLKDIRAWTLVHNLTCDVTDFSMTGYVYLKEIYPSVGLNE